MSALVGALRAMLTLDSTAFVAGSGKAQSASKRLQTSLTPLRKRMLAISAAMGAMGAGLALAIKGQLNAADEMGKAAQKFGVPVEALSRLKYAADLSDVSMETLGTGLKKLSSNMVAAAKGGKSQTEMFAAMGVSVVDAEGKLRGTEAVLQDVAAQFASMPDGAEKTALAVKLFGKAGADMIPLLNAGKTGLQAMAAEATKLGLVISADTARSAENFNDNLTRLKGAMGGLVVQITASLAPTLEKLSGWAVEVAKAFGELSPETRDMIVQVGAIFGVVALAAAGFALLSLALSPVSVTIGLIAAAAFLIKENWGPITEFFRKMWADIKQLTSEAWTSIKTSIGDAIDWVTVKWDAFMALLTGAVDKAKTAGQAIADALSLGKTELNDGTIQGMGGAMDGSADMFGGGTGGSNSTGAAAADGMVDGFKTRMAERIGEIQASAASVTDAVRAQWQVQSPSKVFREIGQFLTEGLSLGIKDNVPMVKGAMGEVGDALDSDSTSLKSRLDSFKSSMQSAFVGLVTGAQTFKEALGNLAKSLADMLAQQAFQQLFGKMFEGGGFLSAIFGGGKFADGAAFSGGRVTAFANGGVVNGVTAFGMHGGLGIMGEAGPEAIMPLTRGSNGKLGVMSQGGGAQRVQIDITEGPMFGAKVEAIADNRSVQIVRRYDRDVAPQSRSRPSRERG